MKKKEILEDLIYDENLEFERVVPKVKKIVQVRGSGEPVIVCNREKLSQREIIAVYLIGKYFAKELELNENNSAANKEIAEALRLDVSVVGARIKDLRDDGLVEKVSRGKHKIVTVKLEKFLDNLINKLSPAESEELIKEKEEKEQQEIDKELKLLDNLDDMRIAAIKGGKTKDEIDGISNLINQQLEILKSEGLEEIKVKKGDKFDPTKQMEALSTIETDELPEGHVYEIFRRGFTLNGEHYRDTRTVVSKKKEKTTPIEIKENICEEEGEEEESG